MIDTLIVEDDYHVATIHAAYVRKVRGFDLAGHASTLASARAEIRLSGERQPADQRRTRQRLQTELAERKFNRINRCC